MGKSIRIFLADTDVSGIRHAEIVNWTGQAIAFPRNRVAELKAWPEVKRQGVYFLLGQDDKTGQDAVYIGEAEVVAERIVQHVSGKEFWSECIAFTSKDENLTKSHIKYLEAKLAAYATAAKRYVVMNSSTPTESALPRSDKDAMDEFAANVRILLGVLGHRVLEPTRGTPPPEIYISSNHPESDIKVPETIQQENVFSLKISSLSARAVRTSNEIIVLENSEASKEVQQSLGGGYRALREKLISTGVLVEFGDRLVFSRDYPFTSASQAAAIIAGYSINGRSYWKSLDGRSLKQIEEAEANSLGERLLGDLTELHRLG